MGACLFVLPWSPAHMGGVNEAVLGLAGALKAVHGPRPVIGVTCWSPIPLPAEVRGIPVIGIQLHDGYEAGLWAAIKSAARLPSDLLAIAAALKTHDVEIVNFHYPSLGGAAFVVLQHLGAYRGKVALTFHGTDIRGVNGSRSIIRSAWKTYVNSVDKVFVCSSSLAAEVGKLCPQKQVRIIPNGAAVDLFSSVARVRGTGTKRILHVGKYDHNKAHDVLLAAFKLLLDRRPDCVLTLIGAAGPALESVRGAVAAFGDRVRLLVDVPHDRIPEYMADCDLFVLPSRAEGFPIVLIEAGAAGLPVVASRIAGVTEFIADGTTGLLVAPANPVELADAMRRVLDSDELASSLAANLRAQAAAFTWERAAQQFIAALS
jgi:L-malate glycosyltransferase